MDSKAATYAINKFPRKLRPYALAHLRYLHGEGPQPQPSDFGLSYVEGQRAHELTKDELANFFIATIESDKGLRDAILRNAFNNWWKGDTSGLPPAVVVLLGESPVTYIVSKMPAACHEYARAWHAYTLGQGAQPNHLDYDLADDVAQQVRLILRRLLSPCGR